MLGRLYQILLNKNLDKVFNKDVRCDIQSEFHLKCGRSPNFKYFVTRQLYIMFLPRRRNARLYNLAGPATRPPGNSSSAAAAALRLYYQQINLSFVFASYFVLLRFCFCFFSPFALEGNKKLSGGERSGYNLFYSRLARNSAVDGWTPIYPHLSVINVNGLARVGACE